MKFDQKLDRKRAAEKKTADRVYADGKKVMSLGSDNKSELELSQPFLCVSGGRW